MAAVSTLLNAIVRACQVGFLHLIQAQDVPSLETQCD